MADPPGEESGAFPTGSAKGGSPQPEAETADSVRKVNPWLGLEGRFEQALSLSRIVVVVPVIVLLLAAISSFAYGTDVFVRSVSRVVEDPNLTSHNLGFLLLLTDLFLVGATLMIAAFGFYDLFISRSGPDGCLGLSPSLSGGLPGPHKSTAVRLSRPQDVPGHHGVHGRPRVSTPVASRALATTQPAIRSPRRHPAHPGQSSVPALLRCGRAPAA